MDHVTHHDHGQRSDPHAGHAMSHEHRGHDRHAGHSVAMFPDKFWLSFALTIPTVFWSSEVQHWLGYAAHHFFDKCVGWDCDNRSDLNKKGLIWKLR